MPQTKNKCKKCGSVDFIVMEQQAWEADTRGGDDTLHCTNADASIDNITCRDCGEEHQEHEFKNINFN